MQDFKMCLSVMENSPSTSMQVTSEAKQEANHIDAFEPRISTAKDQQELKKEGMPDEEYDHIKDNRRRNIV